MIHWWNNCCGARPMTMPSDLDEYPLQPMAPVSKTEDMLLKPGHLEKWKQKPELLQASDSGSMFTMGNPLSELGLQKNRKSKSLAVPTRNGSQDVVVPSASVKALQGNADPKSGNHSTSSFVDSVVSSFRGGMIARILSPKVHRADFTSPIAPPNGLAASTSAVPHMGISHSTQEVPQRPTPASALPVSPSATSSADPPSSHRASPRAKRMVTLTATSEKKVRLRR
jgi:hypothetical protein